MKNTLFNRSIVAYEDAIEFAQRRAVAELFDHLALELLDAARRNPEMTVQDAAQMLADAAKEAA